MRAPQAPAKYLEIIILKNSMWGFHFRILGLGAFAVRLSAVGSHKQF